MYKLPVVLAIIILLVFITMASLSFTLYDMIGLQGRVDRALKAVQAMKEELVFVTNSLFIQVAYTEYLRGKLEQASVDYKTYGKFLDETLFYEDELDDLEYLHTHELSLEVLLAKVELKSVGTQVQVQQGKGGK